ncbi:hypothetical protein PENCOP_c002G04920 [Penicillium coprophilum]|uniref:Uncharacterized protein n=1 Tax=Penicillium coprophilum TaxID=36646 RepID=A0A1V6V0G2_9EURO|nr:hypothetical protein PENCOP_c002G04920 [Penicillium coprophilum]
MMHISEFLHKALGSLLPNVVRSQWQYLESPGISATTAFNSAVANPSRSFGSWFTFFATTTLTAAASTSSCTVICAPPRRPTVVLTPSKRPLTFGSETPPSPSGVAAAGAPINLVAGPTMLEQAAPGTPAAPTTASLVYWGLKELVTQCKVLFAQVYPSAAGMKSGEQATTETPAASATDVTISGGLIMQQDAPNRSGQQIHGQINGQSTAAAKSTQSGPQVDGSGSSDNLISNAPQADDMTPQGRSTIQVGREYLIPARIGSSPLRVVNIFPGETLVGQSTESVAPANQAPTDQMAIERASRMFADTVKAVLLW